jgi:2-oxoglutarate dehydrogenase E1 component
VISSRAELAEGSFKKILPDPLLDPAKVKRVMLCTGKIYYDLIKERKERELEDQVAVIRIEQLYPLSIDELGAGLEGVPKGTETLFVQDEPLNMGAWPYIKLTYVDQLREHGWNPLPVTRAESASPSTGSMAAHLLEQSELIREAFAGF